jgi:hypothetical protein
MTHSRADTTHLGPALLRFGLAALATWRLTHLLANEDGPADVIAIAREKLGDTQLGNLMDCFHCTSIWVAAPFAFYAAKKPADRIAAWLALSAAACLMQQAIEPPEQTSEPTAELSFTSPAGNPIRSIR